MKSSTVASLSLASCPTSLLLPCDNSGKVEGAEDEC
jgi:hypothetical protein